MVNPFYDMDDVSVRMQSTQRHWHRMHQVNRGTTELKVHRYFPLTKSHPDTDAAILVGQYSCPLMWIRRFKIKV